MVLQLDTILVPLKHFFTEITLLEHQQTYNPKELKVNDELNCILKFQTIRVYYFYYQLRFCIILLGFFLFQDSSVLVLYISVHYIYVIFVSVYCSEGGV